MWENSPEKIRYEEGYQKCVSNQTIVIKSENAQHREFVKPKIPKS